MVMTMCCGLLPLGVNGKFRVAPAGPRTVIVPASPVVNAVPEYPVAYTVAIAPFPLPVGALNEDGAPYIVSSVHVCAVAPYRNQNSAVSPDPVLLTGRFWS